MPQVHELFSLQGRAIQLGDQGKFEQNAVRSLLNIRNQLSAIPRYSHLSDLNKGFSDWLQDESHGIEHSYQVFERARQIRDMEGLHDQVSDEDLFARALLHDAGEFLSLKDDRHKSSKIHPFIMAAIIAQTGKDLQISDTSVLMNDILHHDDFWHKPTKEQMQRLSEILSPAGKILADADRLVLDTTEALHRNRIGSLGKWYVYRPEVTTQNRLEWRPREKGLVDGLATLLTEFNGPDEWFYTQTGKEMNRKRKPKFKKELIEFYQREYTLSWELLQQGVLNGARIDIGLKGDKGLMFDKENHFERNYRDTVQVFNTLDSVDRPDFRRGLRIIMSVPVSKFKEKRVDGSEGRDYYGYSMALNYYESGRTNSAKTIWLDPSILQFKDKEELTDTFERAIAEFRVEIDKRYG